MPVYRFSYLFVINNATRQHFTLVIRIVLMFMCAAGFLEICFTAAERVSVCPWVYPPSKYGEGLSFWDDFMKKICVGTFILCL